MALFEWSESRGLITFLLGNSTFRFDRVSAGTEESGARERDVNNTREKLACLYFPSSHSLLVLNFGVYEQKINLRISPRRGKKKGNGKNGSLSEFQCEQMGNKGTTFPVHVRVFLEIFFFFFSRRQTLFDDRIHQGKMTGRGNLVFVRRPLVFIRATTLPLTQPFFFSIKFCFDLFFDNYFLVSLIGVMQEDNIC